MPSGRSLGAGCSFSSGCTTFPSPFLSWALLLPGHTPKEMAPQDHGLDWAYGHSFASSLM